MSQSGIVSDAASQRSLEQNLAQASRHLDASEIPEALAQLNGAIEQLKRVVRAARVDVAEGESYPHIEQRYRLSALRELTGNVIERLEAAWREVEDELTAVRSQKAFERQTTSDSGWFESRA